MSFPLRCLGGALLAGVLGGCAKLADLEGYEVDRSDASAGSAPLQGPPDAGTAPAPTPPVTPAPAATPLDSDGALPGAVARDAGAGCDAGCAAPCPAGSFARDGGCQLRAVSVAVGGSHSCAVLSDGSVRCWGDNALGQLGVGGDVSESFRPLPVNGLERARQVVAGGDFSCALLDDGSVRCWGDNAVGQLGNGTTQSSPVPVPVIGVSGVARLGAGDAHACAAIVDGTARCWGQNDSGQLGTDRTDGSTPAAVERLSQPVLDIAGSFSGSCARAATGGVECWGFGLDMGLPSNVLALAGGGSHFCAALETGAVQCWGYAALYPVLGAPLPPIESLDVQQITVPGLSGATGVAAGLTHSCALVAGNVSCWGDNLFGVFGVGVETLGASVAPVAVPGLGAVVALASSASSAHLCALLQEGSLSCWGNNGVGQLGREPDFSGVPAPVAAW